MSKYTSHGDSGRELSQGIGCCWFQCKTGLWLGRCSDDSIVRNSRRWCLNVFMTHSCIIDLLLFAVLFSCAQRTPLLEMFAKLLSSTDVILHLRSKFWLLFVHSGLLYQLSSRGWQAVLCDKWHQRNATVMWSAWDGQGGDRWSEWVLGEFAMCCWIYCFFVISVWQTSILVF